MPRTKINKTRRISCAVTPDEQAAIEFAADRLDLPVSHVARRAIRLFVAGVLQGRDVELDAELQRRAAIERSGLLDGLPTGLIRGNDPRLSRPKPPTDEPASAPLAQRTQDAEPTPPPASLHGFIDTSSPSA